MKLAITGGSGSIGKHFPTECIRLKTRLEDPIEEMQHELQSLPKEIECIIHLAGLTTNEDCDENPDKAFSFNVNGSEKWFLACQKNLSIKKFIFISTSHVYDENHNKEFIDTDFKTNPKSLYAKTKLEAENRLVQLETQFSIPKLSIVRLFSTYSLDSNKKLLYPNLHRRAKEKDFSPMAGLFNVRDFLPVFTVVKKLIQISKWKDSPRLIHICSGKPTTILEIAESVFQTYGLNAKELLTESKAESSGNRFLVGRPTEIPE